MKILHWLGWCLAIIAALIVVVAAISMLRGKNIGGFTHLINYFHAANTFLLGAIALFIATKKCNCDCK
ncbi:MAG: hypothetical protein U0X39_04090 [Bacteroidales bacterium]